jgi:hypothetical protein
MNVVDLGGALHLAASTTAIPEGIAPAGPDSAVAPAGPDSAVAPDSSRESPPDSSSLAAADSSAAPPPKRAYPAPAELPTQQGPNGIRFDFNDGCRVVLPEGEHPWRVRLSDIDTGNILFETEIKGRPRQQHQALFRARAPGNLGQRQHRVQPRLFGPVASLKMIESRLPHTRRISRSGSEASSTSSSMIRPRAKSVSLAAEPNTSSRRTW